MFKTKIINYLFLIYILFMIKDIFIMSDVYVINIKENKNSEKLINSYISIDQLNSKSFKIDEIDEISDNIKKRINSFLRDKKVFITISQNLNIIFGKKISCEL